ncbi:MAG: hypothetical protein SGJ21_06945 [Alphaproteobacteria bacterium]|nr:hypothetical protein [Alphaproteobacteria bacterium]
MSGIPDTFSGACLIFGEKTGQFADAFAAVVAPELRERCALAADAPPLDALLNWYNPSDLEAIKKDDTGKLLRLLVTAPLMVVDHDLRSREFDYLLGVREAIASGFTLAVTQTPEAGWAIVGCRPKFIDLYSEGAAARVQRALRGLKDPRQREYTSDFRRAGVVTVAPTNQRAVRADDDPKAYVVKPAGGGDKLPTSLGIKCGDIAGINDVAIWVNSENNRMQMARVTDKSISAKIRLRGSNSLGLRGEETDDAIAVSLARAMGVRPTLRIGDVLITETPRGTPLRRENNVVAVAHVAAVVPRADGDGFESGGKIDACVTNVLDEVERFIARRPKDKNLLNNKTIVFPLFGAGDGGLAPEIAASQIVGHLVDYVRDRSKKKGRPGQLKRIYLLAFDARAKMAVESALKAHGCEPDPSPDLSPDGGGGGT